MFGRLTNFEGSLFYDLRRMQREMEEMYGPRVWPAGIRSVARGNLPADYSHSAWHPYMPF
jgi:hypothetical protein